MSTVQVNLCQNKKQFVYTTFSELVVFMYWSGKSINNLLSYCGLVDPRISASDKDLPAQMYTYLQKNMEVNFAKSKEWCMHEY